MLRARLDVNGIRVGLVVIQQVEELGDDLRGYTVAVNLCSEGRLPPVHYARVTHNRSEGPFVLLRKALEMAGF